MTPDTLTRLITYDDYRHLPATAGKQYQIIGGALYMTAAPTTIHQGIAIRLSAKLFEFAERNKRGEVLAAPIDVVLSMTDVVQPDIVFVTRSRLNIITKKNIVEAPDLVVEILSEHTETIDRQKKKLLYEHRGVKEYWLVDPETKTVEQYLLKKQKLILKIVAGSGEQITSSTLEDFVLPVQEIFG